MKTIKGKLLGILLSFLLITCLTSVVAFKYFVGRRDALAEFVNKTESIHVLLLEDVNTMHQFFEVETINPTYFYSRNSDLLTSHQIICKKIGEAFISLNHLQKENDFLLTDTIVKLQTNFANYTKNIDSIIDKILIRGFKDFGIEGNMRHFAHQLELHNVEIGLINVLQLRRHEKDYIIRQEEEYANKHTQLLSEIQKKINASSSIGLTKKEELLNLLNNYSKQFANLVIYEKNIGLRKYGGLKLKIDQISVNIVYSLSALVLDSKSKVAIAIFRMELFYLLVALVFVLIGLIAAVFISRKASQSVTDLKNKIVQFVESDFTKRTVLPINNSQDEVDTLITNVSVMEQHIVNQMEMLKQSNNDLEMLFYATSRDIRMPLINAMQVIDLAIVNVSDPQSLQYFKIIKEKWLTLIHIVDDLGIITSIKSVNAKSDEINFQDLIKSIYGEFESHEKFNEVILSVKIKTQNKFYSSLALLRSVFRNLIENSLKYSKGAGQSSFIKIEIIEIKDGSLHIQIIDNGIGIKEEHQEKIFDMFYRGTAESDGVGLGLYIVKSAVEKLEGTIICDSIENLGSTFSILLPNAVLKTNLKQKIIQKLELVQ